MKAIATSRATFMLSAAIRLRNSGSIPSDCKLAEGFLDDRLVESRKSSPIRKDTLSVDLSDGRTISVPLAWFPRLLHATQEERKNWRLVGKGHGIHWDDIDEDISVEGLLADRPSGESQASFKKWLAKRPPRPTRRSTGRAPRARR
jgi:hypothetical protein